MYAITTHCDFKHAPQFVVVLVVMAVVATRNTANFTTSIEEGARLISLPFFSSLFMFRK